MRHAVPGATGVTGTGVTGTGVTGTGVTGTGVTGTGVTLPSGAMLPPPGFTEPGGATRIGAPAVPFPNPSTGSRPPPPPPQPLINAVISSAPHNEVLNKDVFFGDTVGLSQAQVFKLLLIDFIDVVDVVDVVDVIAV